MSGRQNVTSDVSSESTTASATFALAPQECTMRVLSTYILPLIHVNHEPNNPPIIPTTAIGTSSCSLGSYTAAKLIP